ncbi:MAG: hypothetical protein RL033_1177 [Pseudomonadota bacterium]|jgi:uncharacterized protein GlcG (DUF336 family)
MKISNTKMSTDVIQLVSVLGLLAGAALMSGCATEAKAQEAIAAIPGCAEVPAYGALQDVLKTVVHGDLNGGAGNEMWGAIVNREGVVCSVAFSGDDRGAQFPGSRTIAAAKANTSNAFSLPDSPLASGNLYKNTQPGGPIFGLESGNPVDTAVAYQGESQMFGTAADPLVGKKIGGTIVFGGGLPLYNAAGKLVGGIGVSGDSSCADHIIAWEMRAQLNGDNLPAGTTDNLTIGVGEYPDCGSGSAALISALPSSYPLTVVAR